MKIFWQSLQSICILAFTLLFVQNLAAHNGKVGYAYPLRPIIIDGDFSDWPQGARKYMLTSHLSDIKPQNESDFSGFFEVGYRLENRSLYIALTVTDNDFIEDTTGNVRFNTQDGLELCLDARHLPFGSGVASFMYSKKLRNINRAFYDSFSSNSSWDIMEVAMVSRGHVRYYEWRIELGAQLEVGRSVGLDFQVFDKDTDGSFTFTGWGKGGRKIIIPNNLGDVILVPGSANLATIRGKVSWDREMKEQLPDQVRLTATRSPALWLETEVDSMGNYSIELPPGKYEIVMPEAYLRIGGARDY